MELKNFIAELESLDKLAKEFYRAIGLLASVEFHGDYWTISIIDPSTSSSLYCSQSTELDDLWNELNALTIGAKLAKGYEV